MSSKCRSILAALLIALIFLSACRREADDSTRLLLAQVGAEKLYFDELPAGMLRSLQPADSISQLKAYVTNWVQNELIYNHALQQGSDETARIERQVKNFRRSLLIDDFERNYIQEKLDTAVLNEQIESFYNSNADHFALQESVVKCLALSVPATNKHLPQLRALYRQKSKEAREKLEPLTLQAGVQIAVYPNQWLPISTLQEILGVELENWVKQRQPAAVEMTRDERVYLICFHNWIPAGEKAPIEFIQQDVKAIILNQRRKALIDSLERNLFQQGIASDRAKIFIEK